MNREKLYKIVENLKEEQGINVEILLKELLNYLNSDDIEGFLKDFCALRDMEYIYFSDSDIDMEEDEVDNFHNTYSDRLSGHVVIG